MNKLFLFYFFVCPHQTYLYQSIYTQKFVLDSFNAANHNHNISLHAERCSIVPLEPLIPLIVKKIVAHPSVSGRWKEQQETAKFARERISFHVLFYVLCESLDPLFTDVQIRLINLTVVSWFLESRRSLLANLKFGSKVFHKASTYKSNINRNSSLSSEEYFPVRIIAE